MKLTDFLYDVGRPIAYYPNLRKITGSTGATILLCQFLYWRGKESNPDGWLFKTSDEIEEETGLTYDEQQTARKKLLSNSFIEEHYERLDHTMKFKVNLDTINSEWGKWQFGFPEGRDSAFGKDESPFSLNGTTETTTENTSYTDDDFLSKKDKDLVDGYLELSQSPGIKKTARVNAILSYLGENLHLNLGGKRWEVFARFVDDRQQGTDERLEVFLLWMLGKEKFDIQYWPPSRMREMWPQAFQNINIQPKNADGSFYG